MEVKNIFELWKNDTKGYEDVHIMKEPLEDVVYIVDCIPFDIGGPNQASTKSLIA